MGTERLTLLPFTRDDGPLLKELFMDPEVTEYLPWGHPFTEPETERRLRQLLGHWRRHGFGTYAIRLRRGRRPFGYAGLEVVEGTELVELLYAISRSRWGKGFAYEAAAACVRHGFEAIGLDQIVGVIAPGNEGSKRVLKKLGMKPAPRLDFYGRHLRYFSMTREQYAARLEAPPDHPW